MLSVANIRDDSDSFFLLDFKSVKGCCVSTTIYIYAINYVRMYHSIIEHFNNFLVTKFFNRLIQ